MYRSFIRHDLGTIATIIGIVTGVISIITVIIKLFMNYGKTRDDLGELKRDCLQYKDIFSEKLIELSEKQAKYETKSSEKFKELYIARNETQNLLTELTTKMVMFIQNVDKQLANIDKQISNMDKKISNMESKIDGFYDRRHEND